MKKLRRILPVLLLLALPVLAQEAEPEAAKLEIHDVRDLVTADRTIDALAEIAARAGGQGFVDAVPHGSGTLVIRGTKAALERVAGAFADLRAAASIVISLETRFIRVYPDRMKGDLSLLRASTPTTLDAKGVEDLLEEVERSDAAETISAPRLTTYPGQQADIVMGRQVSYVKDFEVVKTKDGGSIADPVIGSLSGGLTLQVTAAEAFEAGSIDLDLDLALVEIRDPLPTRKIRIGDRRDIPVEVQVPETTELRVVRSLTIPAGKTALLALGPLPFEEHRGARLLVLVRAIRTVLEDD